VLSWNRSSHSSMLACHETDTKRCRRQPAPARIPEGGAEEISERRAEQRRGNPNPNLFTDQATIDGATVRGKPIN